MNNIVPYNDFLILERFDKNIRQELIRLGVTDKVELEKQVKMSKKGHLASYLHDNNAKFTFGLLHAIFLDAIEAKKVSDIEIGAIKMVHRIVPIALAPYFPILAIIGYIFGTSRAFNKLITPILTNPGNDYSEFLKKLVSSTMKIAEGDIELKDRFTRAFVVSDNIVDAIKPEIVHAFSIYLADIMSKEEKDKEVPENYIENQLKSYLNDKYHINPKIPLKK